jgi:hypothetical protein
MANISSELNHAFYSSIGPDLEAHGLFHPDVTAIDHEFQG